MTGTGLPALAFGCAPQPDEASGDLARALAAAVEVGYRLFDTAEAYGSERLLAPLRRQLGPHLLVISKVWQTNHAPAHVAAACEASLGRLGMDSLDFYLVHAPEAWTHVGPLEVEPGWSRAKSEGVLVPRRGDGSMRRAGVPLAATWEAMVQLRRRGLARRVGLANVGVAELVELAAAGCEPPSVVQVELHSWQPQRELLAYCRAAGILVMAHTPLARGRVLGDPLLQAIAADAGTGPAELVLGWLKWRGSVPVVGSRSPAHLLANLRAVEAVVPPTALAALEELAARREPAPSAAGRP
ncbi:MAG TPA: aldo/keto reductase [Thermoanaerobaculia bacterium]|nr:aldo/keto reductase [Thermoanaerobaculia bacterium]